MCDESSVAAAVFECLIKQFGNIMMMMMMWYANYANMFKKMHKDVLVVG